VGRQGIPQDGKLEESGIKDIEIEQDEKNVALARDPKNSDVTQIQQYSS
jgi:hypothetical protein